MRKVSGKVSLATRRIWGDPEDEEEFSTITIFNSESRFDASGLTFNTNDRVDIERSFNDEVVIRPINNHSKQATSKVRESPVASTKLNLSMDEIDAPPSKNLFKNDNSSFQPLTDSIVPKQSKVNYQDTGNSSPQNSVSSTVVRPPLSYHDASQKEFAPYNDTKLTWDNREAPQTLQDLDELTELSHQCLKLKNEEVMISKRTTEKKNQFSILNESILKENGINAVEACNGVQTSEKIVEKTAYANNSIPTPNKPEESISKNSNVSENGGKLHLKSNSNDYDYDNKLEILPPKLILLGNCDKEISTNLTSETSQGSFEDEISTNLANEIPQENSEKEISTNLASEIPQEDSGKEISTNLASEIPQEDSGKEISTNLASETSQGSYEDEISTNLTSETPEENSGKEISTNLASEIPQEDSGKEISTNLASETSQGSYEDEISTNLTSETPEENSEKEISTNLASKIPQEDSGKEISTNLASEIPQEDSGKEISTNLASETSQGSYEDEISTNLTSETPEENSEKEISTNLANEIPQEHSGKEITTNLTSETPEEKTEMEISANLASEIPQASTPTEVLNHMIDKNDREYHITTEANDIYNAVRAESILGNQLETQSTVLIDRNIGKEKKKHEIENAEHSETETVKTTFKRKKWLKYVKSFERRHDESDINAAKISSDRESFAPLDMRDVNQTVTTTYPPKPSESPMKQKYAASHSGSTTPDKRRRSLRKKIKEKISDTIHKLKE
ncbi:putative fibrous sheath cabyr-binding [Erysiphe necator]|uniref:Putative fibrous sheath cabyr-binding n=1 Tax=Uncinula necator TaxID=52586 RepID=A0A0B1NW60_UNCNE|nr:putative fibrous sheath cabyr-binding [Erysiphe necator]